jgi:hypothetical protein
MRAAAKDRQISIRVPSDTERERRREREEKLLDILKMFNEAAAHPSQEDLEERESLLGGFAAGQRD